MDIGAVPGRFRTTVNGKVLGRGNQFQVVRDRLPVNP